MRLKRYKLGEIADLNKRNICKSELPKKIIYLDTSSIAENVISETAVLDATEAPCRAQRKVEDKTIIYSTVRPRLKHYGILNNPQNNLIVSTGFATIDLKDAHKGEIDPHYLYLQLTRPSITEYLGNISDTAASAYPSIHPSALSSLLLKFPSIDIQKSIANIWANYDQKMKLNRAINRNLSMLDRSSRVEEVRRVA